MASSGSHLRFRHLFIEIPVISETLFKIFFELGKKNKKRMKKRKRLVISLIINQRMMIFSNQLTTINKSINK